ncbi:MAG: U32 family peptidase [Candidatus Omnitrophica bacterium]|nr:U32 family peptidase [Candidatus Omnitrophota bacterium]MCF7877090.1 U32 family peptidase [Candidatus Omnitrophota bacterium]MCF7878290.1 U32 family peptidase [Candidatus Omnitrophota bacterium]MCF7893286.1 U32 family peptidase [Candidatus Omnitrophota bacterium]
MVGAKKVELVCGAGGWPSLKAAVEAGSDSVYFGLKKFNMRANASNFDTLELKKVVNFCHKSNKKAYLTLNSLIYDDEIFELKQLLSKAKEAKIDAVILWDMAAFEIASQLGLRVHLSTQASVANFSSLKKYAKDGARRIVLARECRLWQIKKIANKIKKEKINCQLEAFIHGAMCVSISGRCLLSELSFLKPANRGQCLQVCRREFKIIENQDNNEYVLGSDYILSPKDLCAIDFIGQLIRSGLDAFKIEGRKRSPEYIFLVVSAYRKAIDAFYQNKLDNKYKDSLIKELEKVYNRGFSSGFYFGKPKKWRSKELENKYQKRYLGIVKKFYKKIKVAEIEITNGSLSGGETLLFIGANTGAKFAKAGQIQVNHQFVDKVTAGKKCGIKLDFTVKPKDKIFIWSRKE